MPPSAADVVEAGCSKFELFCPLEVFKDPPVEFKDADTAGSTWLMQ